MTQDVNAYYSSTVVDETGDKIGDVGQVYLDDRTGEPSWVTVKTGFFGAKESFVPVGSATLQGGKLRVPYTKEHVKGAPGIDPDKHISDAEQDELYRYYGFGGEDYASTDTGVDTGTARTHTGVDTSVGEDEVVRREERLRVGTETTERGRARLRKYVVTETQQVEVPVSREELRVERVPLDESDASVGGIDLDRDGDVQEIVLNEERPVVGKETVGVEKVRVGKETVTDTETVSADVAKERVDIDPDDTTGTARR